MTMTAKYTGVCGKCGGRFPVGEAIVWTKGSKPIHQTCSNAAAPQPAATVPSVPQLPPPFALPAGEGWTDRGVRAVLYLLSHGPFSVFMLDDDTLEAAYHGAGVAATAPQLPADVAETLARLQRDLRGDVARRERLRQERDARLQALFDAADQQTATPAPIVAPAAPQPPPAPPSNGGGGSKVPRTPKPNGQPPAGSLALPRPVLAPMASNGNGLAADELF